MYVHNSLWNDEGEAIKVGIYSSDSVPSMKRDLGWEVRNDHPKRIPSLKKFSGLKCARLIMFFIPQRTRRQIHLDNVDIAYGSQTQSQNGNAHTCP